jgi:hypothetical protein
MNIPKNTSNAFFSSIKIVAAFNELLVAPLSDFPDEEGPIVIVLDALDECGDVESRRTLLQLLAEGTAGLPSFVRILVTSREMADLSHAFTGRGHILTLNLNLESDNRKDVLSFIESRLEDKTNMQELSLPSNRPKPKEIQALADRAAGLFIWASTACQFIDSHDPRIRLEMLLRTGIKGNAQAALDKLYKTALESAGNWKDDVFCSDFSAITGAILVARNPISPETIDKLLALNERPSLRRLGCVLHFTNQTGPVRILHPSFADFLSHKDRCATSYIDTFHHNKFLAIRCVDHLDERLKENICNLTLTQVVPNSIVPHLHDDGR